MVLSSPLPPAVSLPSFPSSALFDTPLMRRANRIPSPVKGEGAGGGEYLRRLDTDRPPQSALPPMLFGTSLGRRTHRIPSPLTGGKGGGEHRRRLQYRAPPPIPSFPRQGGRGRASYTSRMPNRKALPHRRGENCWPISSINDLTLPLCQPTTGELGKGVLHTLLLHPSAHAPGERRIDGFITSLLLRTLDQSIRW
jgi:hypothetical protein